MRGRSKFALPSLDRGRLRPQPATLKLRRTSVIVRRSLGVAGPHLPNRSLGFAQADGCRRRRRLPCGRGRPRSMNVGVRLHDCLSKFPVFPCCEGISKGGRRNLRAGVSPSAQSPSRMRLPLTPRHATKSRAPDISCYVFGNAAVCLEIRGDNRRILFCTIAARRTHALGRKSALQPVGDAARKRSALRLVCRPNPGKSAGRKNPVPKCQAIDSPEYFALQNFRANEPVRRRSFGDLNATPAGRTQANGQGLIALFRKLKRLNLQQILE
jgi:hypothetical protein